MPTWTFIKRGGAPAGTIKINVADGVFVIDDSSNPTISTTNPQVMGDLQSSPFIQLSGPPQPLPVIPSISQSFLADGKLSRPGPGGTITTFDGSEFPDGLDGMIARPSNLQLNGHSYMDPQGIGITNAPRTLYSTPSRIATLLGVQAGQVQNLAVSGAMLRTHTVNGAPRYLAAINPGKAAAAPQVPKTGLSVGMWGANDLISGTGTVVQNGFINGYRAIISRMRAAAVWDYNDSTVAKTGTWTDVPFSSVPAPAWGSGAGCTGTTTIGDKITITLPSANSTSPPPSPAISGNLVARDTGTATIALGFVTGVAGGTATIQVDGVTVGTIDTSNCCFSSSGVTERGANVVRIPVTSSSSVITVTVNSIVGGGPFYFNYWQVESNPSPLFLISEIPTPAHPPSFWGPNTPANVDIANTWIDSLVTEFNDPSVRKVKIDDALGKSTIRSNGQGQTPSNFIYYSLDGLHPNDRGAQQIAAQVLKEVGRAFVAGVSPAQVAGYNTGEKPPVTGYQSALYHGSGVAPQLVDGFDGTDTTAPPSGWTAVFGGWGRYQNQLALVNDAFPYPSFADNFQRANGSVANGWTTVSGTWAIVSNELTMSAASTPAVPLIESSQLLDASGNGGVTFAAGSVHEDFFGIAFRIQDAANFWSLYMSNTFGGWVLSKVVANSETTVVSGTMGNISTSGNPDNMHVELNGSTIKVFNNGTLVNTTTDATFATARGTGIRGKVASSTTGPTADFFDVRQGTFDVSQAAIGFNACVRDVGFSDGTFSFVTGSSAPINFNGVIFRYVDASNYLRLYESASFGGWVLAGKIAGTPITNVNIAGTNLAGTNVAVVQLGNTFTFSFNGVASTTGPQTVASAPAGTKVGVVADFITAGASGAVVTPPPVQLADSLTTGGVGITLPDSTYWRDDRTGIIYGPVAAGVTTDQIPWVPSIYGVDGIAAVQSLRKSVQANGQGAIIAPTCPGWTYANGSLTARRLYMNRFVVQASDPITQIGFFLTLADSTNDPIMVGILDTTGKVLAVSASTLGKFNATANTMQQVPLSLPFTPTVGTPYFACMLGTAATFGSVPQAATCSMSGVTSNLFGVGYAGADFLFLAAQTTIPSVGTTLGAPSVFAASPALSVFTT